MMSEDRPRVSTRDILAARARETAGLDDYGDPWFFENLDALIPFLNGEANLTPGGVVGAETTIVSSLVNRLRHVDLIKRHPEILDEEVRVAAVVAGLPRTGSTMLHRLLASAPGMTGVKWWECQNYAPFPGEARGDPEPRRAAARTYLDYMLKHAPDLMSIHPMDIDQPDEELIIMGSLFSSSMLEGMYYIPGFSAWVTKNARTRVYRDLKEVLQSLQWQDPKRKGHQWVLKTPGHLLALDAVLETFPDAKIVMTHRDPNNTVPSYCSMLHTLYSMGAEIDRKLMGPFLEKRLAEKLNLFMTVRETADDSRFIDVRYTDLTKHPIEEGKRVLAEAGIDVTPEIVAGMNEWIEANRREDRAPHVYTAEDFGVDPADIARDFGPYMAANIKQA